MSEHTFCRVRYIQLDLPVPMGHRHRGSCSPIQIMQQSAQESIEQGIQRIQDKIKI